MSLNMNISMSMQFGIGQKRPYKLHFVQDDLESGRPREEFTMSPPAEVSSSTAEINFDPLPEIHLRWNQLNNGAGNRNSSHPAGLSVQRHHSTDEWFDKPHTNFPRSQLQYIKELGRGWFGHVLEGRAVGIFSDHSCPSAISDGQKQPVTVAVKVLREDASSVEQIYFLNELKPFRDLQHENILSLYAYCLEKSPFLIILEYCSKGDLKAFISNNINLTEDHFIKFCCDLSSGLAHMHAHNFIHTDLAARNCLVTNNMVAKIGDYGCSINVYKNEYYLAGDVALPLRWCSPATLKCTETTIETKEVTKSANVWSFGVTMWEIFARGTIPYKGLDNDEVIQTVIIDKKHILHLDNATVWKDKLNEIVKICMSFEDTKIDIDYINSLLTCLASVAVKSKCCKEISEFEERWNQLQSVKMVDNHSFLCSPVFVDMRFENDFVTQGSLKSDLSPSLQNLRGSVEDLEAKCTAAFGSSVPSWLGVTSDQQIDSFVMEISDAINRLDEALAGEKSEASSVYSSPDMQNQGICFRLGKDSLVTNPPLSIRRESIDEQCFSKAYSDCEEEGLTMRLEKGDFSEMVRIKSQSVQNLMKLTVVDEGSDSDKASQPNSVIFDNNKCPHVSEKTSSSETNLKDVVRDSSFMLEIERMQSESKCSTIAESNKEDVSFLKIKDCNDLSFLSTSSPDCIMSTIEKRVDLLPDIVIHNAAIQQCEYSLENGSVQLSQPKNLKFVYEGSVTHENEECINTAGHLNSTQLNDSMENITNEFKIHDNSSNINLHFENSLQSHLSSTPQKALSEFSECSENFNPKSSLYMPEEVIEGQNIVIGALEDYSLGLFNAVKSSSIAWKNYEEVFKGEVNDESTGNDCEISEKKDKSSYEADSFVNNHSELLGTAIVKSHNFDDTDLDKSFENESSYNDEQNDKKISHFDIVDINNEINKSFTIECKTFKEDCGSSTYIFYDDLTTKADIISCNVNTATENDVIAQSSIDSALDGETCDESGEFWHQQMSAWQEAALETKQLLQQAAKGSQEVLNTADSEHDYSPESNESTPKSVFSSTDKLSTTDDEGTYVSYNATDDEEILGYKDEDINKLRAELNLKLGISTSCDLQTDSCQLEDELDDGRENIIINYRGIAPALSPIKEESYLGEETFTFIDTTLNNESVCQNSNSSVEFFEVSDNKILQETTEEKQNIDNSISLNNLNLEGKYNGELIDANNSDEGNNSCQMRKNDSALILEDLEAEDGPSSISIYDGIVKASSVEDILVINTETNEAAIVGRGKPHAHLAFVSEQNISKPGYADAVLSVVKDEFIDDVAHESLPIIEKFQESRNKDGYQSDDLYISAPGSCEESLEVKPVISGNFMSTDNTEESCDGFSYRIELPTYHPYFSSAMKVSTQACPSLDEISFTIDQNEHTSLPYDVNYIDDKNCAVDIAENTDNSSPLIRLDSLIDNRKYDEKLDVRNQLSNSSGTPIHFLGSLYYQDNHETNVQNSYEKYVSGEAKFLSDSDSEDENKCINSSKLQDISKMSSAQFLASKTFQIMDDQDDIEENIENFDQGESDGRVTSVQVTPVKFPHFRESYEQCYTPDWESEGGSDVGEDSNSTMSDEFIWKATQASEEDAVVTSTCKPGEVDGLSTVISSEDNDDGNKDEDSGSEIGEEDFVPSTWNKDLTPSHSLLRSPLYKSLEKKNVTWKKERYHRVYEYPPEPHSWSAPPRQSWGDDFRSLQYFGLSEIDLEIGLENLLAESDSIDAYNNFAYTLPESASSLSALNLDSCHFESSTNGTQNVGCDFYIGSPRMPLSFGSSTFNPLDYFPNASNNDDIIFSDAVEGISVCKAEETHKNNNMAAVSYSMLATDLHASRNEDAIGGLRHMKNKLTLDLPLSLQSKDINENSSQLTNRKGSDVSNQSTDI